MGQKIHPLGLRIGITQKHRSKWCTNTTDYPRFILEDKLLRDYLFKKYAAANIVDIIIHRRQRAKDLKTQEPIDLIEIFIHTPVPIKILNKNKQKSQESMISLRSDLEKLCQKKRRKENLPEVRLSVNVLKVFDQYTEASIIADDLIKQLEARVPFRLALKKVLKPVLDLLKKKKLNGIRIQIAGRLNGAEIARTEWFREGRIPLHTLRADVNYCYKTAKTIYGIMGIKVWTFKEKTSEF